MMGDISRHFNRSEFRCKGCTADNPCERGGVDTVDVELVRTLEGIREYFGASVYINSGHRCPEHNAAVGGSPGSQHLLGRAADIRVEGVSPSQVASFLGYLNGGVGEYQTFTHVDTRGRRARWKG